MGTAVIRQPDGLLCVFSTIVDDFTYYDCEPSVLVTDLMEYMGRSDAQYMVDRAVERGQSGFYTLKRALEQREMQHGDDVDSKGEDDDADFAEWLDKMRKAVL